MIVNVPDALRNDKGNTRCDPVATALGPVNPVDHPAPACESVLLDPLERSTPMSAADHMKNTAEKLAGKAKEAAGKVTDNEKLENEGRMDQAKADLKDAGEDLKDDAKKAGEHLKDATQR